MKFRQMGAELFHVDRLTERETDVMTLVVAYRNCAKAPGNVH